MNQPAVSKAKGGLDKITTEIVKVPQIKVLTIDGVKGVWIPLHPLTQLKS